MVTFSRIDQSNGRLISSGQERKYLLYVPETYDPDTPVPLVISMHGFADWPAHQKDMSRWNDLADKYGFIVVYPSGTSFPKRWNVNRGNGASQDTSTDVQFISDLIDKLQAEYNIDETRIYANGLSNGGGMSTWLGCKLSQRIAAVGSVAGAYTFSPDDCNFSRPVPLIAFHGTADRIVPYEGASSTRFHMTLPAIPDWIKSWALRNGCNPAPDELSSTGEVSGVRYTGCAENAEVIFYTIQGGGHSWPGGGLLPKLIVGKTTQDIDATEEMWQFFSQHSLAQR